MGMTWQPSDESGSGMALAIPALRHVSSYWPAEQSDWQVSVPFSTPPSARIVAPLLTWQIEAGAGATGPRMPAHRTNAGTDFLLTSSSCARIVPLPPRAIRAPNAEATALCAAGSSLVASAHFGVLIVAYLLLGLGLLIANGTLPGLPLALASTALLAFELTRARPMHARVV